MRNLAIATAHKSALRGEVAFTACKQHVDPVNSLVYGYIAD